MSLLFKRVYKLDVGSPEEILTVDGFGENPAQIVFRVQRSSNAHIALANIDIYGLNKDTRQKLYKEFTSVRLTAGYAENYGEIFNGTIYTVGIGRDGPDTFVSLFCRSAGEEWLTANINQAFGPGTPRVDIIRAVAATFNKPLELIGDFDSLPSASDGLTLSGDSKTVLRQMALDFGFAWELDSYATVLTRNGAVREMQPRIISASTGMVGSPQIRERGADITVKLDPRIQNHDPVIVENATGDIAFNNPNSVRYTDTIGKGVYQVWGVTHVGDFYGNAWDVILEGYNPRVSRLP